MIIISLWILMGIMKSTKIEELNNRILSLEQQIDKLQNQLAIGVKQKQNLQDDDQSIFLNGISQKMQKQVNIGLSIIHQFNSTLQDLHLLNIKSLNHPNNLLLILLENQTNLIIINQLGNTICEYQFEYPIQHYNIHQFSDEVIFAIMDYQTNAYHFKLNYEELNAKQNASLIRDMREVDEDGYFDYFILELEHSINIRQTIQSYNQTYYPINAIIINQARNSKIYLLGDSHGQIMSIFTNGTFKSKTAITKDPILNFIRRHPHILYQTRRQIGFINSITLQVAFPLCEKSPEDMIAIYQENIHSHFLYVLLKTMEILVYQIKQGKQSECNINFKIYSSIVPQYIENAKYGLTIANSYLMLNQLNNPQVYLFNLTLFKSNIREYFGDSIEMNGLDNNQHANYEHYSLKTQKTSVQGSFAFETKSIKQNQTTISLVMIFLYMNAIQFMMNHIPSYQSAFSFNFLESFRFPMILVAIFVVFIFQFWQKRKKNSDSDDDDDKISLMAKQKIDSMVEEYQQARKKQNLEDEDGQSFNQKVNKKMPAKEFFDQNDSDKDWLED